MKDYIKLFFELILAGYPMAFWTGFVKKRRNRELQKEFGFHMWHILPIEHRLYALKIADFINGKSNNESVIVEIGCGLGTILTKLKNGKKFGYDISEQVIEAARKVNDSRSDIKFEQGSFDLVKDSYKKVDFFITANFMHEIEGDVLKSYYQDVLRHVEVTYILADEVRGDGYKYNHDLSKMLAPSMKIIHREKMNDVRDLVIFMKTP